MKSHTDTVAQAAVVTDEMVQRACETYSEVYADDDKDMGDAMLAVLKEALAAQPPASPVETEVQDTWLVGGPPDFMAMSGSVESDRVIQLHMRYKATDDDRKWLLDAINAKLLADREPVQSCSAGTGDLDELQSELTDSLKPQGELRPLCLKAAEAIADLRHDIERHIQIAADLASAQPQRSAETSDAGCAKALIEPWTVETSKCPHCLCSPLHCNCGVYSNAKEAP